MAHPLPRLPGLVCAGFTTAFAVATVAYAGSGSADVITANPDPSDFTNGSSIAAIIGADRFYSAGFNGSSAIVANVEAGYVWNGHEALGHVNSYFRGTGALGEVDRHATWVGMVINGRPTATGGEYQRGLAYGATMRSGAIATVWLGSPFTRNFDFTVDSFADAYKTATVGPNTADVTNSSWSDGSDPEGARWEDYSRAVDAIALVSGKTMVFSVGNRGPGSNTVGAPASGFNVIAVGSLGSDVSVPQYGSVSSFSSRGPQPLFVPNVQSANFFTPGHGTTIANARAAVDIVAPGENLVTAFYGGTTGGNTGGTDSPGNNIYSNVSGTSFAAPVVASGATLMADAARQTFGGSSRALDGRVMKANLLNSTTKIAGWNNSQSIGPGGVIRTTQALDYAAGAGALNLNRGFDQLLSGTTDVAGTGGGSIGEIGWDYGVVSDTAPNDYRFSAPLLGGSTLTVTLDWFIDRSINLSTNATLEASFDNLDLQIWSTSGNALEALIAESVTQYNEVEHLSFILPTTDEYLIRVLFAGEVWDLTNDVNQTPYGLSWAGTLVPEPVAATMVMLSAPGDATKEQGEMILGILSDTHGRIDAAREAIRILRARGAEYFIHCGDVGDDVLALLPSEKSAFVFGNNDFDRHGYRDEAMLCSIRCLESFGEIELSGKRIAVTHGDEPRTLREIRASNRFDYMLTGHTHVADDHREGSLRCINPGALHRAQKKTVATLDLKTDVLTLHEVQSVRSW